MRCPDCSKFVSMDNADPEINSLDASITGEEVNVSVDFRHCRNCADCGTELKDINENADADVSIEDFSGWEALTPEAKEAIKKAMEAGDAEVEVDEIDGSVDESGGGRYKKNIITISVEYYLKVTAGEFSVEHNGIISSDHAAGEYCEC